MQHNIRHRRLLKHIVGVVGERRELTIFARALAASGLGESLQDEGPYTMFPPTDSAFARLAPDALEALLGDRVRLVAMLSACVVKGRLTVSNVLTNGGSTPPTLNGRRITIQVRDGKVFVDGAMVVRADIAGTNGVIHGVDSVMLPELAAPPAPPAAQAFAGH